jgi:uncharacterized YccA/Bax inhibitor family protein
LFIIFLFAGCNNNKDKSKQDSSQLKGTIYLSVDESFRPVMEEQIRAYESSFPDTRLIATFKPQSSGYLAPGYAIFEGLFIGGISAIFEVMYPGIVIQAVSCTFVTFMVCFGLYKYEIVKVNEKFRSVVIAATLAIATYYLISWLLTLFTSFQPVHHGNSMMSIGISAIVIIVAALNLFLDFDQIEKGVQQKMPKYMEWYGAMGLMITLVWLYIEFLRLLSKLSSRK